MVYSLNVVMSPSFEMYLSLLKKCLRRTVFIVHYVGNRSVLYAVLTEHPCAKSYRTVLQLDCLMLCDAPSLRTHIKYP